MASLSAWSNISLLILSFVFLLRILVGFQPHSGQDDHHGSKVAYGGDFEAQRHWMELTVHVPIGDWYWYDLEYWGLDYPPLTAYHSWLCGKASKFIVGPESVALGSSRGLEDPFHKAYMRGTVLLFDALVYFTAVWAVVSLQSRNSKGVFTKAWLALLVLAQPSLILIDHGHFQYNTISLGFALWSFFFVTKGGSDKTFSACVIGSVFFCLSLNFKQMALYYAPAIFSYLLGQCFQRPVRQFPLRFCALGVTVIATFMALWWPFLSYEPTIPDNTTVRDRLAQVLHRLFPFQRGLFEGKVSNLWCALSAKPFRIRERIPMDQQPIVALGMTTLMILPACYKLFCVAQQTGNRSHKHDIRYLLWGATSTSLAFFLASFQVHEKSILMAVAPLSLLMQEDWNFVNLFCLIATWTLFPLLQVDQLQTAYACIVVAYIVLLCLCPVEFRTCGTTSTMRQCYKWVWMGATLLLVSIHLLEILVEPPRALPDVFPLLWSIVGCGLFVMSWLMTIYCLYRGGKQGATKMR